MSSVRLFWKICVIVQHVCWKVANFYTAKFPTAKVPFCETSRGEFSTGENFYGEISGQWWAVSAGSRERAMMSRERVRWWASSRSLEKFYRFLRHSSRRCDEGAASRQVERGGRSLGVALPPKAVFTTVLYQILMQAAPNGTNWNDFFFIFYSKELFIFKV